MITKLLLIVKYGQWNFKCNNLIISRIWNILEHLCKIKALW